MKILKVTVAGRHGTEIRIQSVTEPVVSLLLFFLLLLHSLNSSQLRTDKWASVHAKSAPIEATYLWLEEQEADSQSP